MTVKVTISDGKVDPRIIIVGIICLTILELVALFNGINGTMFTMIAVIIAAAVGVVTPTPKILKNG